MTGTIRSLDGKCKTCYSQNKTSCYFNCWKCRSHCRYRYN
jgi:hypothetical protein